MKRNRMLIKAVLLISLALFITIPINLTIAQTTYAPETTSVKLSALPYDWVSIWSRFDDNYELALDVAIDTNNDVIVGGQSSNSTIDYFVAKFDETGTQLWNDTRDGGSQDRLRAIAVSGTDIYVGSDYRNQSSSRYECFLGKYDGLGNYLWNVSWFKSGASGCYTSDMTLSQTGEFYFIGEMAYPASTYQYFILKLDSGGTEVWNVTFGVKDGTRKSINGIATYNDLIYVVGQERNQTRSEYDPLIACFNATTGYQLWNITWDKPTYYEGHCMDVIIDSSGNFYVTGYYDVTYRTLFLRKYNSSRDLLWESTYKDISSTGYGIALEDNSNVFIAGNTKESSALLINFASNGTLLGVGSWKRNNTNSDSIGYNVDVDSLGNVYLVGSTPGISGTDAFIIKDLELSMPSNGSPDDSIPGFNLWIVIGVLSCIILLARKKYYLRNQ